jgi:hypothetical protein
MPVCVYFWASVRPKMALMSLVCLYLCTMLSVQSIHSRWLTGKVFIAKELFRSLNAGALLQAERTT